MDEPITFHATRKYRIQRLVLWVSSVTFFSFFGLYVYFLDQEINISLFLVCVFLPLFLAFRSNWKNPKKLNFVLYSDSIGGSTGNQTFQLPFSKVLHIENLGHALRIDAADSQHLLEKRHFDLEPIQVELQKRLHPDVFVDGGWINLPAYQTIKEQQDSLLAEISDKLPLQIKQELQIATKSILVIFILFSSAAAIFFWRDIGFGALLFLLFAFLCGIPFIHKGVLKIDNHQITYETRFRKYRILWDDVVRVEHDDALSLAFHGQNQCLRTSINSDFKILILIGAKNKKMSFSSILITS
ncbi:hypothetical protein [Candidatus Leptofilum sp.]|uniref:hypothetical protein n=1 Tax=Candidatus Leptofilum sp. TaxID=3241576 RepID=UPI003B5A53F6